MQSIDYGGAIGSLQYLSCTTRPDIAYTVGQLAFFTSDSGVAHWNAIKHLFRYIKGTLLESAGSPEAGMNSTSGSGSGWLEQEVGDGEECSIGAFALGALGT